VKSTHINTRKILLVDDDSNFYRPISRWLQEREYVVTIARSYQQAEHLLGTEHFHLAIIDLWLQGGNGTKDEGLILLADIEKKGLADHLPCIVLTGHSSVKRVMEATQKYNARYIPKDPGYDQKLLDDVDSLFTKRVKINFDLEYELDSIERLPEIADEVNWASLVPPPRNVLISQVQDLFGKLFNDETSIYLSKMKPGLTGSALVRVEPSIDFGVIKSSVVKINRIDKVEPEASNYEKYVQRLIPNASTHMIACYTSHLGGIKYTFMESQNKRYREFDEFFFEATPDQILKSLEQLFFKSCSLWYTQAQIPRHNNIRDMYYSALALNHDLMAERLSKVIPGYESNQESLVFPATGEMLINPLYWITENREKFVMPVRQSITHGDLTGRNIMVDEDNKCWLIDFFRTYPSHILRDFMILETDIKYRLMSCPPFEKFISLETRLLNQKLSSKNVTVPEAFTPEMSKTLKVLQGLHSFAANTNQARNGDERFRKEFLLSLLMVTLNVIRLKHILPERKLHALYSAVLICKELEKID
jgi:two-component system, response regulator RegA